MTLPPASSSSLLGQACAAAALRHSTARAAEAAKAARLASEAAEEAERRLLPRVRALLSLDDDAPSLRVDLGSGVLARPVSVNKEKKTVILPIGLGFYLESGGTGNGDGGKREGESEALALAAARVAALRDRASRAAARASRARSEAEGDARAALARGT